MRRRCRCCGKNEDNCNWKDRFVKAGLKFTNTRQYIISIAKNATRPLSAEEVYDICNRDFPDIGIGIATVYRTLEILFRLGFLSRIEGQDKISRFSVIDSPFKVYLQCTKCNSIKDISKDISKKRIEQTISLSKELSSKYQHEFSSMSFVISGICTECK